MQETRKGPGTEIGRDGGGHVKRAHLRLSRLGGGRKQDDERIQKRDERPQTRSAPMGTGGSDRSPQRTEAAKRKRKKIKEETKENYRPRTLLFICARLLSFLFSYVHTYT